MIIIDCTALSRKKTGIENYTEQVIRSLVENDNGENSITLLFSESAPAWAKTALAGRNIVVFKSKSQFFISNFLLPLYILKSPPKVLLLPAFPASVLSMVLKLILGFKLIKIVYDGVMWLYPDSLSTKNKIYFKPLETLGMKYYDKIPTISESSKNDLQRLFPSYSDKFTNIGTSLITRETLDKRDHQISKEFSGQYFLFVGTLDFRKNIEIALEAFKLFSCKYPNVLFVIAGRSAWGSDRLKKCISKLQIEEKVRLLGYVADEELEGLYQKAIAFVFPSIYEGYGLPIVEAMHYKCPVIASNNSSIPEATDGSAILIENYHSPQSWLENMDKIYNDELLRKELIERGTQRVANLSWNNVSAKLSDVIRSCLNE